ncbi:carbohydrate ABC transporter permease [Labrys wisconsinensis]|uniref:ABC-type glycerol-3-phosphate transport system permease component n=1 Tax=Labrys wisconsinensis TaxID=425677 RepID=A0ABU0JF57_9HYPH|nr:carbohydrate ABC transporter permease [Labrys wisconsinensis]MDQ0472048.1 ABC-type glycerol-3-phosphate transport system permease component [Labrys wisconsinensis]
MRRTSACRSAALDLITLICVGLLLLPILWVFAASLRPETDITGGGLMPTRLTLEHYAAIIGRRDFMIALGNSLIVGIAVTLVTTALAVPAAFALSRLRFGGKGLFGFLILGTQMLPSLVVMVPLVVIFRNLGLNNTLTGLTITHLALGMPIAVWMLKGYVDAIPRELEEAAMIDGCSHVGAALRIVIPLIRPAIVAVGTFAFVLSWGEYIMALALITKSEVKTLPLALQALFDPYSFSWGQIMAGGSVIAMPAILLFLLFRKQLVGGLLAGGVKG